jgi:hypothetical protein
MRPEIWVSITCTDRATSLRALAMDLAEQAARADATVRLLINDNSIQPGERYANHQLIEALAVRGVGVEIETAPRPGASIAASRRRQQEQLRERLAIHPRPAFVWMLDDDVRLSHLQWTNEFLDERPLHCHLGFLREMANQHPDLDVLIGEVCGDPPIPVLASVVSRLTDLEASLRVMFSARPDALWRVPDAALERLAERDAYYDLSVVRPAGAWQREILWLPRGGSLTTVQALVQMLADVDHVPRGAAFSRPVLAAPERFAELGDRPLRGANAVFFDVERCLQHEYPSLTIAGIETRRSDMIGTGLLADAGAMVCGSGFCVLHHRPRDTPWPTSDVLLASLVADTLGAWLVRKLDPRVGDGGETGFLAARLERLQVAASAVMNVAMRLRRLAGEAPAWAPALDPVHAVADWALGSFPGARDGALPAELLDIVHSTAVRDDVAAAVRCVTRGKVA